MLLSSDNINVSWDKCYDFSAANFDVIANGNPRYKRNEIEYDIVNVTQKCCRQYRLYAASKLFLAIWQSKCLASFFV